MLFIVMHPWIKVSGLELDDINLSATFGETMDLLTFQKRLRIIAEISGLPWQELKRTVMQSRLPVSVIEKGIRDYGQDQPERKGSELNDIYLLSLAAYADVTYVDKRTLESVRRTEKKIPGFNQLVRRVEKARNYNEISASLATL